MAIRILPLILINFEDRNMSIKDEEQNILTDIENNLNNMRKSLSADDEIEFGYLSAELLRLAQDLQEIQNAE